MNAGGVPARRVRRAYEQVYDQLREGIFSGAIPNGGRLPAEGQLATDFGVGRGTVREALRLLLAEGLIQTTKGARGGSFVTLPTVDHVTGFLQRNIELLSFTDDLTLDEFLQARRVIEIFAARQAAMRHSAADIEMLRHTLELVDSADAQYLQNRDFHFVLIRTCGNALLRIAAEPIYSVLHTHLSRSELSPDFARDVARDHAHILDAIEADDPDEAERRMSEHLESLGVTYRKIWRPQGGRR